MKLTVNIISILSNIIISMVMLFIAFIISAPLFGVQPTSNEAMTSLLLQIFAIVIIILSCFIVKFKHIHLAIFILVTVVSIAFLILEGSSDYPAIYGIYLFINLPLIIYRYLKL